LYMRLPYLHFLARKQYFAERYGEREKRCHLAVKALFKTPDVSLA